MPTRRFEPPQTRDTEAAKAYDQLARTLDARDPLASYPVRTEARLSVASTTITRLSPRSAGQEVVVPTADGSNFGQTITLIVEGARGALRVRAVSGTINGFSAYTLPAGYSTLITLQSNGSGMWALERASGFPTAGNALAYDGEELNYVGSSSLLRLSGSSGNLGTIDISSLECGGALCIVAAAGDYQIEGFTASPAKGEGFWFTLAASNTSVVATLFNEDSTAAAADRLRLPGNSNLYGTNLQGTVHAVPADGLLGGTNRWRCVIGDAAKGIQRITTSGLLSDIALDPGTRTIEIDTGNSDWRIDGIAGGWPGRKLTIRNAQNIAGMGSIITDGESASAAANRIITPRNKNRGGYSRYSAELEYDGTDSFWRIVSDTGMGPTAIDTNVGVGSISTSDQGMATLTVGANTISEGTCFEFFGSCRVDRVGTTTATNIVLRLEIPSGTAVFTSGNIALNTTDPYSGTIMFRGTITFGAPGATCPMYIVGEVIHTLTSATAVVIVPLPSLTTTVDTTTDTTFLIESDGSAALAGVTRTRTGSYIRQI